jgi:hypothetical protein
MIRKVCRCLTPDHAWDCPKLLDSIEPKPPAPLKVVPFRGRVPQRPEPPPPSKIDWLDVGVMGGIIIGWVIVALSWLFLLT